MHQVPYTLLLVDDQTIFLDGIESLLAQLPEVIPFGIENDPICLFFAYAE